jgi:Na+-driven multidrug efflux pump
MLLTFSSTFGVRIPLALLLGVILGLGLVGIWIALASELMFRGGLFLARFLHGGWTKIKV